MYICSDKYMESCEYEKSISLAEYSHSIHDNFKTYPQKSIGQF